ncbi:MAG TPA: NADH-quinone oxidoreductase subunit J [Actinomycetota bacterium]|nr:NADH-quinone oxidoreductase subunit J [Actinomycetota bacterium]
MTPWVFIGVAVVMSIAAIRLVTTKNLVHGALYLVVTLMGVAVVFLLTAAEFVAWVQVLIYVGAVIVLLLFGLMLTKAPIGRTALDNDRRGFAALVALGIFAVTGTVLWTSFEGKEIQVGHSVTTEQLGTELFTRFVLPFEVVSVLLLAALVGAVILAKRD